MISGLELRRCSRKSHGTTERQESAVRGMKEGNRGSGGGILADSNLRQLAGEARKKTCTLTFTEMAMRRFHTEKRKKRKKGE